MRTVATIVTVAAVAAGLASCSSPSPAPSAPAPAAPAANLAPCTADDVPVAGDPGTRPTITVPDTCSAPPQLLTKDLVVGTGPEVTDGATMAAQYELVTWSNKQQLDSSWERGEPFTLENVGHAQVIDGWNEGLVGMKQGGRRLLVVPPDQGYGEGGRGIRPNETLVFVVDAVQVTK